MQIDRKHVNETFLKETVNGRLGEGRNPFHQPHYLLLNLAIGRNGERPSASGYPLRYEIDYVRVYQK